MSSQRAALNEQILSDSRRAADDSQPVMVTLEATLRAMKASQDLLDEMIGDAMKKLAVRDGAAADTAWVDPAVAVLKLVARKATKPAAYAVGVACVGVAHGERYAADITAYVKGLRGGAQEPAAEQTLDADR